VFTANEAADGLLQLAKAGFTAQQSMDALPGVLDLAAAGDLSVARASELAANAINAWNLPASDAARVADVLAAAANASSVEVEDLAISFEQASALASANRIPIEDLSTALAILGNNGLKGEKAGTAMKVMLQRLFAPTDKAKAAMDELGISIYNADGSSRSLEQILGNMQDAMSGLTEEQRNNYNRTLLGSRASNAAIILIKEGTSEYARMKGAVMEAGAASKVADAKMKGLAGAWIYAKSTIEATLISAFLPASEALARLLRQGADLISRFLDLPGPVRNAAMAFAAVLAVAGPLLIIIPLLGAAVGALLSPFGLVVLAVAAFAAAWAADWGGIREKTATAVDWVGRQISILRGWIDAARQGDMTPLIQGLGSLFQSSLTAIQTTIDNFSWSDFITGTLSWATYVKSLAWNTFVSALTWGGNIIKSVDWGAYIAKLAGWGTYVKSLAWNTFVSAFPGWSDYLSELVWGDVIRLNWDQYIGMLKSWKDFVSELTWSDYVSPLNWALVMGIGINWENKIKGLVWSEMIDPVRWASYIVPISWGAIVKGVQWHEWLTAFTWNTAVRLLSWATYVDKLNWADYVTTLIWASPILVPLAWKDFVKEVRWYEFVGSLLWDTYVAALDWAQWAAVLKWRDFVAGFNEWADYVEALTWSDFVDSFHWPVVTWPGWTTWISNFVWPTIANFAWSKFISAFSWPSIPSFPGWGALFGGGGGGKPPDEQARGTLYAPGGLTLVGETGPELVEMPRGARVYNAGDTRRMGGESVINNYYSVSTELDIESIIYRVAQMQRQRGR